MEHRNQSAILYHVASEDMINDKKWMKNLKTKKFKLFLTQKKYHRLQMKRIDYERQVQELDTKVWCFAY